jgi:MFS family permease
MGVTGYLPLYLQGQGWGEASADGTLSAFYAISTVSVVPLCFLSDRIGSRKAILFPAIVSAIICFALLPVTEGGTIYALMLLAGISFDSFASLIVTTLLETEGIGSIRSGIVLGTIITMSQLGNFVIPPLGNSMAAISVGAPFFLWSGISALALVPLIFTRETGWRNKLSLSQQRE